MKRNVCLDFNGVLDTYAGWIPDGVGTEYDPRPGVQEFLQELHQTHNIIISTVIDPAKVKAWLERYGLSQYIGTITNSKPIASAYLDDRAVRFDGNFQDALEQIRNFKPYWEMKDGTAR